MFEGIIEIILTLLGGGMLLLGIVAFAYGLYGMSVKGFSKNVQNFSLVIGIFLIAVVTSLYYFRSGSDVDQKLDFVGKYRNVQSGEINLELKKDGTFIGDSALFSEHRGKWEFIDMDEVYLIELNSDHGGTLKSFEIIRGEDYCKLRTQNNRTNVEEQLELIRLE